MAIELKGNKGEWSELYVFLRLLSDGVLYGANENLDRLPEQLYPIIKVMREERKGIELSYCIDGDSIQICNASTKLKTVARGDFGIQAKYLLKTINETKGSSFECASVANFSNGIMVTKLKAPSGDTTDIKMTIHDQNINTDSDVGFSIKSYLGGAPSLLNASHSTNFIFEVDGIPDSAIERINQISDGSKIRRRVNSIYNLGGTIKFLDIESPVFKSNLIDAVDTNMPAMLAHMMLCYYSSGTYLVSDLLQKLVEDDPLNQKRDIFYRTKVSELLSSCALGMKPNTPWSGVEEANGGYIVVKENGEIVIYHIYNRNTFKNYLLKSTQLETPSSTRHQFGVLYKENGKTKLKLNLQIRFLKPKSN